jgi:hypothetical protein
MERPIYLFGPTTFIKCMVPLYAQFYFCLTFLNGIDFLCFLLVLLLLLLCVCVCVCVCFFFFFNCLEFMAIFFKIFTIFLKSHKK